MTELLVRTEAHVEVVLQIKDITVFVLQASPQLTVIRVFATNGSTGTWMILFYFILVLMFHSFTVIVSGATRRLGDEQARLCCDWRLEWINCTGRYLPCLRYYWCTIEQNIIEKTKRKKKKREKIEGEKKLVYIVLSAAY